MPMTGCRTAFCGFQPLTRVDLTVGWLISVGLASAEAIPFDAGGTLRADRCVMLGEC